MNCGSINQIFNISSRITFSLFCPRFVIYFSNIFQLAQKVLDQILSFFEIRQTDLSSFFKASGKFSIWHVVAPITIVFFCNCNLSISTQNWSIISTFFFESGSISLPKMWGERISTHYAVYRNVEEGQMGCGIFNSVV